VQQRKLVNYVIFLYLKTRLKIYLENKFGTQKNNKRNQRRQSTAPLYSQHAIKICRVLLQKLYNHYAEWPPFCTKPFIFTCKYRNFRKQYISTTLATVACRVDTCTRFPQI